MPQNALLPGHTARRHSTATVRQRNGGGARCVGAWRWRRGSSSRWLLSKQCFASAGCSIAYQINVNHHGSTSLDPSKTYTVVYDLAGAASPITANFTIHGTKVNAHHGTAYTPNKDATLTATVTSVLEGS